MPVDFIPQFITDELLFSFITQDKSHELIIQQTQTDQLLRKITLRLEANISSELFCAKYSGWGSSIILSLS
ncbi:MAG: hypothetical protein M0P20_05280 [Methanocorpusculum sp.]|nr:hypothetical protein [Methanocorpusculum sp.]MDD3257505.1 hypothetical protein [Methanocorpusculum sp.]